MEISGNDVVELLKTFPLWAAALLLVALAIVFRGPAYLHEILEHRRKMRLIELKYGAAQQRIEAKVVKRIGPPPRRSPTPKRGKKR